MEKKDFPRGVLSPNGEFISKTYGIESKKYNPPPITSIKGPLRILPTPFIDFKRVKKAVDKEEEQEKENKLEIQPLKFLNNTALILDKKEEIIIDPIFQGVLKEKEKSIQENIEEPPKVKNKKEKKKAIIFSIDEKEKEPVKKEKKNILEAHSYELNESIIQQQNDTQYMISTLKRWKERVETKWAQEEEEKAPEPAIVQPLDVKSEKDEKVFPLQKVTAIAVKQPVIKKEEKAVVPVGSSKAPQGIFLKMCQAVDAEIEWLKKDVKVPDKYIRSLEAYKAYLTEKSSRTDPKDITKLMFSSYKDTLPEKYNSILSCVNNNNTFIISSWLSKLLKAETELCEGLPYFKDREIWSCMMYETGLLFQFFEDDKEKSIDDKHFKLLACSIAAVGSYALRYSAINKELYLKDGKIDKKLEREVLNSHKSFSEERLKFYEEVLVKEYPVLKEKFEIGKKCPSEDIKITLFLADKAPSRKEFFKNCIATNPKDPVAYYFSGYEKFKKFANTFNYSDCFKGLECWQQVADNNPHESLTNGMADPLQKIADNLSVFLPIRRRTQKLLVSFNDLLTDWHEMYKKAALTYKNIIKQEIELFDVANKTDQEIKDKAKQAYLYGFDQQAIKLFDALKKKDVESTLYCADIYQAGTILKKPTDTASPNAKALILLSEKGVLNTAESNSSYFALSRMIIGNLVKQRYIGAATISLAMNENVERKFKKESFQKNRIQELQILLSVPDWHVAEGASTAMLSILDTYSTNFSKDRNKRYIAVFDLLVTAVAARQVSYISKQLMLNPKKKELQEELKGSEDWSRKWVGNFTEKVGYYLSEALYRDTSMMSIMEIVNGEFSKLPSAVKNDPAIGYAVAVAASYASLMPSELPKDAYAEKIIWGPMGDINKLSAAQLEFYLDWLEAYWDDGTPSKDTALKRTTKVEWAGAQKGSLKAYRKYVSNLNNFPSEKGKLDNNAPFEKVNEQKIIDLLIKNNPGQEATIYFLWIQQKGIMESKMGIAQEILNDMSKWPDKKAYTIGKLCLDEKALETKLINEYVKPNKKCKPNELKSIMKAVDKLLNTYIDWLMDPHLKAIHASWAEEDIIVNDFFNVITNNVLPMVGRNTVLPLFFECQAKLALANRFSSMLKVLTNNSIASQGVAILCSKMDINTKFLSSYTYRDQLLKLEAEMFCSLAEKVLSNENGFFERKDCAELFIDKANQLARNKLKNSAQKEILDRLAPLSMKVNRAGCFTRIINGTPTKILPMPRLAPSENVNESNLHGSSAHSSNLTVIDEITKKAELANEQLKQAESCVNEVDAMVDAFFEQDVATN